MPYTLRVPAALLAVVFLTLILAAPSDLAPVPTLTSVAI